MATDFSTLEIRADSRSVKTATNDMGKMGAASTKLGGALRTLAPALAAIISVRALGQMASEAREFGKAMGEVNTLLSDTSQLERVNKEALALAATFGGSPTEQAKGFYQAISAGAGTAAEATDILVASNKLAIGGVTEVATAVDGLTSIINAFGLETSDATSVSDALFVAMKAGKTTVGELSASVGKLAPIASSVGLSMEEMLGAVSALTTQGISTSESVNGLKAALSNVLKPTKEASDEAARLGLNFGLAALQEKGFTGFMESVVAKSGGSKESLVQLFGSVEALNTVFALTGGASESFVQIMDDMKTKTGETEIAFGKIAETMDQKLEVLSGKIAVARVEVGEFFLALAEPIIDNISANFDTYKSFLVNLVKGARATTTALITAFAPFQESWRVMMQALGQYTSAFTNFAIDKFNSFGVSGLRVSELLAIGFGNTLGGITAGIEANTIEVAAFVDKTVFWLKWMTGQANEQGDRLKAIDKARTDSLEAVRAKYEGNAKALQDQLIQVRLNEAGFSILDTTTGNVAQTTDELTGSIEDLTIATGVANGGAGELNGTLSAQGEAAGEVAEIIGCGEPKTLTESLTCAEQAEKALKGEVIETNTEMEAQGRVVGVVESIWNSLFDSFSAGESTMGRFFENVIRGFEGTAAAARRTADSINGGGGFGMPNGGGGNAGTAAAGIFSDKEAESNIGENVGRAIGTTFFGAPGGEVGAAIGSFVDTLAGGDGFERSNSGFLLSSRGGGGEFDVPAFDSGFDPVGFSRRSSPEDALRVIDQFRAVDSALTEAALSVGLTPNLGATSFGGFNEEGEGNGLFFGNAGGDNPTPVQLQLDQFTRQWITAVGGANGIDQSIIDSVIGTGGAQGIVSRANENKDGSFAGGISRVPFDGFRAELHQGERVLTASETNAMDSAPTSGVSGMIFSILSQIIKAVNIIRRWDQNGLPAERA